MNATKHSVNCNMAFGRKDPTCPRCQELLAGAELRPGWQRDYFTLKAHNDAIFCPAKGSLYLMADGSERLVENLMVGDVLAGIDGDSEVIEEIQSATSPVLRIQTEDGFTTRNSRVHAFALPVGGFVVAINSLNKIVLTEKGRGKVVAVEWDGEDTVYNVITDGSHTYRADGVWALGVGEAERQVSMAKWGEIGDNLAEAVSHGRG